MDALAIAVYRFWIYAVFLLIWMAARGKYLSVRIMRATAIGGLALGLDVALFFSAVKQTTIINATVITALQPIIVGAVAWRLFGERIRPRNIALAFVALAAVVVVVAAGTATSESSLRGDMLAVGAVLAWSAYFVFARGSRDVLTAGEFTVGTAIWTAAINTPLALAFGQDLSLPTAQSWGWLILLAVGAGTLGHVLMNWSLVRIPLWLASTFTLLIPVVAAAVAWAFLDQALSTIQIVGILVVVGALMAIVVDQRTQDLSG